MFVACLDHQAPVALLAATDGSIVVQAWLGQHHTLQEQGGSLLLQASRCPGWDHHNQNPLNLRILIRNCPVTHGHGTEQQQ